MAATNQPASAAASYLVRVELTPSGSWVADAVGLPNLPPTAATREAAVEQVRRLLGQAVADGELVVVAPDADIVAAGRRFAGHSRDDPDFDAYQEEIRRFREEVDEQQCSSSSSTPTT